MMNNIIQIKHYENMAHAYGVHGEVYSKGYKYAIAPEVGNCIFVSKVEIPLEHRALFEGDALDNEEQLQDLGYDVIHIDDYDDDTDERCDKGGKSMYKSLLVNYGCPHCATRAWDRFYESDNKLKEVTCDNCGHDFKISKYGVSHITE